MKRLTGDHLAQGKLPNTLMVMDVDNTDRTWNSERLDPPPSRTGKFDQFMDEVKAVARRAGYRFVLWPNPVQPMGSTSGLRYTFAHLGS